MIIEEREARPSRQEDVAPVPSNDTLILSTFPSIGNPKDVSEAIGIPENGVRQLCRTGKLRAFKCGALWRIPKAWLLDFIEQGGCLANEGAFHQGGERSWLTR